jgi:catechol 2,3-dioxygenase-like lactoylglutathione lyase family enzyme
MGGPKETALRLCLIGIGDGALELFEFADGPRPAWVGRDDDARLPHLCLTVEDVRAAVDRFELAGGRRLWPEVRRWGDSDVIYVADPDGNTIEFLTASLDHLVAVTRSMLR